jgi:hypothetical protein
MRLKECVLVGVAMLSLGLFMAGCSGTPPENSDDKKASAGPAVQAPDAGKNATGKPKADPGALPPPPGK